MAEPLPSLYLARHGETAWTVSKQHTGLTDIPLTPRGEENARRLADRLTGRTCELAGFGTGAAVDADLVEWNYGAYEGRTTADILKERPGWRLFRDGCP